MRRVVSTTDCLITRIRFSRVPAGKSRMGNPTLGAASRGFSARPPAEGAQARAATSPPPSPGLAGLLRALCWPQWAPPRAHLPLATTRAENCPSLFSGHTCLVKQEGTQTSDPPAVLSLTPPIPLVCAAGSSSSPHLGSMDGSEPQVSCRISTRKGPDSCSGHFHPLGSGLLFHQVASLPP